MVFPCDTCGKTFTHETNFTRHKRSIHGKQSLNCERCGKSFNRKDALTRHLRTHAQKKEHECSYCSRQFYRKDKLDEHQQVCKYEKLYEEQEKKRKADSETPDKQTQSSQSQREDKDDPCETATALQNGLKTFTYKPRKTEQLDLKYCLQQKIKVLLNRLRQELEKRKGIKWYLSVKVKFTKPKSDGEDIISEPHFRSLCIPSVNSDELETQLKEANEKIHETMMAFQREGSGWLLDQVN